ANWREQCAYNQPHDWVFASIDKKGTQPLWPENVLRRHVRQAAERAGIQKRIGFHTFRHSFATILRSNQEDVKTAQELLRHCEDGGARGACWNDCSHVFPRPRVNG